MITFFRRALGSWYVLAILGLVLVAFVVTGVDPSLSGFGGGGGANETVARVGDRKIGAIELQRRVQLVLERGRAEQPGLDIAGLVASGGVEQTLDQLVSSHAIDVFGRRQGLGTSKRLIDGDIASIPAFAGPDGKFDQSVFAATLARQKIGEKEIRADIASDLLRRQMFVPIAAGVRAPAQLVTPYAALLLEARQGTIGIVPSSALAGGKAPTQPEIARFYAENQARYTVPERRVIRYAVIDREFVGALATPSEAEIARYYQTNQAKYAARETRVLQQVVLPDEAAARALAGRIAAGTSFADAAKAAGFSPTDTAIGEKTRAEYATLASEAAAAAAWGLPEGGVSAPLKSAFGWNVVRVEAIRAVPARPFAEVRGEIVAELTKQKGDDALADAVAQTEEAIAEGASFDEAAAARKLTVKTTPALTATGLDPENPAWRAPPELDTLLRPAFAAAVDDDATVETIAPNDAFALVQVTRILPSAPRPLAAIAAQVTADLQARRATERARALAQAIVAKVDAGASMADAFAGAGVRLPPLQQAGGRRADLARAGGQVPPPLQMLFSMAPGKAKLMPAPNDGGWYVVRLDAIRKGDPASAPGLVDSTRGQFSQLLGQEYAEQFARAARAAVGASTDPAAINRLRAALTRAARPQ